MENNIYNIINSDGHEEWYDEKGRLTHTRYSDGYIGLYDYKFSEIDDLDPVEYPKENKEEK